ncbi:hypothetical protein Bca52824_010701 [Brassica carinata]|uniref:Uncharacterized protein n=1 Tax=Brassica carinata TaxID=52824 RepID=A0A8X7WGJ7_BRACI|nr:hypothetical protein Bca52824_010701 [Brassica carinata]
MDVKVATTTTCHWSGRHAAIPKGPSFSQTLASSKRRPLQLFWEENCTGPNHVSFWFTKNRTCMQKHYPLRRVCSASSSFFSDDQDLSARMNHMLQKSVPGLASLEAPWTEMVNHSRSIERKANNVDLPLSLRMTKRKLQDQQAIKEASKSNKYCSIDKAFSSMVFMIDELHSFALQTTETIFYEDLQGAVKKDMHASFLWIFQRASNLAISLASVPVTKGQDQTHQWFESTLSSRCGWMDLGNFDKISRLSTSQRDSVSGQGIREEELSLWNSMVEDADQMQDSTVVRDMKLRPRIELEDDYANYTRTELLYKIGLAQEPNNPMLLANYAQFLYLIYQDYGIAEKCFKNAIELEEADAETYSKYAVFQWKVLKDLWAAEENFLEAVSADPTNSFHAANYANFFSYTGGEETCYLPHRI